MSFATALRGALVTALLAALLPAAATAGGDAPATASAGCAAQKKALERAPAKRKAQARKRYQACKDKALATAIRGQLADQRLVGKRGDGEAVNWLFCANGKFRLESSGRSGRGISDGPRWVVTQPRGTAARWTAIIRESANLRASGLSVGVGRTAAGYVVGISSGADVVSPGAVTRTADPAACAAL